LPSYNQIGFDSLHYLAGMVESNATTTVGWVIGAKLNESNETLPDPATKVLFPVEVLAKNGLLTLDNEAGFTVNAMNIDLT
ncbi:hypothetical protein ACE4Z5_27980, partial [Salmonella enterica]|uniref:hypothetical protein n=1 Tax=Salmonella enterica TaxID=28901 RepID=UPI003D2A662A